MMSASLLRWGRAVGWSSALAAMAACQTVDAQRVGSPLKGQGHVYTGTALQFTVETVSQRPPRPSLGGNKQHAMNTHEKKYTCV